MPGLPPLIGQSAFVLQGSAAALLHVSQKQRVPGKAPLLQVGLEVVRVRVELPVDTVIGLELKPIVAMRLAALLAQSRLVRPKSGLSSVV
jgi:hypothetical protein